MSGIVGKALFVKLASVEAVDKQANGIVKRLQGTRKTARLAGQTCQVVAQFGIVPFHRIGLALVGHRKVNASVVSQLSIGG